MYRYFKKISDQFEQCFYVETNGELSKKEKQILKYLLADGFILNSLSNRSKFNTSKTIIEIGPRMNFTTAWSSNFTNICHSIGLNKVVQVEKFKRHILPEKVSADKFLEKNCDRMTEERYIKAVESFSRNVSPDEIYVIDLIGKGPDALIMPELSMDSDDRLMYHKYFVNGEKRNPTIAEIIDLDNANSEHSRHGYFKGKQIIDEIEMPETLMEMVVSTLTLGTNSVSAFGDNSSGIKGYRIRTILPRYHGKPSPLNFKVVEYHIIFTAETHNHPSGIEPFQGATTGIGGQLRDRFSMGKGSMTIAASAGYCMGNLNISGYGLPWEDNSLEIPGNLASPIDIAIRASDGASDYGNKFGDPVILGFTRSFDLVLANGERWGFVKPIMFTGGIGQIYSKHVIKGSAKEGQKIAQVGGPAYSIGRGGGSGSSKILGSSLVLLDFNSVQRGDAEMENKLYRVVRACCEMGTNNPIISIHDQGAGGPANVLKELVEGAGGKIDIRKIALGDPTMSVLDIWVCEYQERCGFLIDPSRLNEFKSICDRENVNCEILGEVTSDGRFVVYDSNDNSTPVDIDLDKLLGNLPQKTFRDRRIKSNFKPLVLPKNTRLISALELVLKNLSVGSKRHLTSKVDRSVGGLNARQQCCGPLQLSVADCGIVAQSHFGLTGAVTSIGEQPIKMILDPGAGARLSVTEAVTNLIFAKVSALEDIKCSANWMWAPKLSGEGAAMYDAVEAMSEMMRRLGIAVDGGKDSLSMATKVGDAVVKSPRQLVISAYCTMPDITRHVTPDIKKPGRSSLIFLPLNGDECRIGGSALAQAFGQIGNISPDLDSVLYLEDLFRVIQDDMLTYDLILSGHDISDGGLIVTLLEMAFSGNSGFKININSDASLLERMFAEEPGVVIECENTSLSEFEAVCDFYGIKHEILGKTTRKRTIDVSFNYEPVLFEAMEVLRDRWEETSSEIDKLQLKNGCAEIERKNIRYRSDPDYNLSYAPRKTAKRIINRKRKHKVAILRDEGSNSDREMSSAFMLAGLEPWDISMRDIISGKIKNLDQFRGLAAVGGFSYADVPESAKGWAAPIRFNPDIKKVFDDFYYRDDTFSLGVCNGCQLFALIGWVPWRGMADSGQPRFIQNVSGRFESRFVSVFIDESPAIMLKDMAGSHLGIWVAHGEGKFHCTDNNIFSEILQRNLAPIKYTNDQGVPTVEYPMNPNGSRLGVAGLCSPNGRHLALMPHPERTFLPWQWPWMPLKMKKKYKTSAWLKMFQNAREWCENN
jgi:phosphoribosylformylglycinamidine synthase